MALTRITSDMITTNVNAVNSLNIDCSTGTYFTKTIAAVTTFTVSNIPVNRVYALTLELTVTSGSVNWWTGVIWPEDATPVLNSSKTHLLTFITDDGGTTWRGSYLTDYAS